MTATDDTDLTLLALAVRFPLLNEEELRLLAAMGGNSQRERVNSQRDAFSRRRVAVGVGDDDCQS